MDAVMFKENYSKWELLAGIEVVTLTSELSLSHRIRRT